MRTLLAVVIVFLATAASAGDEWQSPSLIHGSSLESTDPPYRMVGVRRQSEGCTAWVVADEALVHKQGSVNRIILSVRKNIDAGPLRSCALRIHFYRAVHPTPRDPSFRITEQLGTYDGVENKTYFSGDEIHYGGWVHGPRDLQAMQPNTSLERTRGR